MKLILSIIAFLTSGLVYSQGCCSGGGGSPLAGGLMAGVLQKNQVEILCSYQYTNSNRFMSGDTDTISFFDNIGSDYLFMKVDYGLTDRFTFSVSTGYYLNRTITEFADTTYEGSEMVIHHNEVKSSGVSDLILFPRYNVFDRTRGNIHSELTLGAGWKIPVGSHDDSSFVGYSKFINFDNNPPTIDSIEIWQVSPPTVQATNGSNDFMFYAFFLRSYPRHNFRLFVNGTYIRRGWNSLGMKFGDYATVGLFAGKSFFNSLSVIGQINGEWVGRMDSHKDLDVLSLYNIEQESTGSFKLSFVPQVNFSILETGLSLFLTADIPLYQYMRGTQIASQYRITGGLAYRFFAVDQKKARKEEPHDPVVYREETFKVWGNCGMCKETIETTLLAMDGVTVAEWDEKTQMLHVRFNSLELELDDLKSELAEVGYDTETHKTSEKAYNSLPACCKYKRE